MQKITKYEKKLEENNGEVLKIYLYNFQIIILFLIK